MTVNRILVVKLSAIGDVIHALPVAYALKEAFPQSHLAWVVEQPSYDLVANHPYIDQVIVFEKARCRTLAGLKAYLPGFVRQLKEQRAEIALDLQGLFKSGMIAFLSGTPKRMVYCNTRELSDLFSKKVCGPHQHGHIVEQYLDVVRGLGGPVTTVDFGIRFSEAERESALAILRDSGWQEEPYAVLVPGANWLNKRWPTGHFAALAQRLHQNGIRCLIIGGSGDRDLTQKIQTATPTPMLEIAGKTSLKQLAWVLQHARVTVGGDTGPMHLSVAVGTPTVAILGPTDAFRNGPYGMGHRAIVAPRDCAGCWRRKCEKQLDCLAAVTVDEVFHAVMDLVFCRPEEERQ